MRCITYAGETVITTDDVAEALVELTAAIATLGAAEAVSIPIVFRESDEIGEAELVIGVGNDVLSVPVEWEGAEPDFSHAAHELKSHDAYPHRAVESDADGVTEPDGARYDPDLEGFTHA
jgi:hypothetical protein